MNTQTTRISSASPSPFDAARVLERALEIHDRQGPRPLPRESNHGPRSLIRNAAIDLVGEGDSAPEINASRTSDGVRRRRGSLALEIIHLEEAAKDLRKGQ